MMPSYNSTFINGRASYKYSTLEDHTQTECHNRADRENNEMHARALSISLTTQNVVQTIPEESAMKKCVN